MADAAGDVVRQLRYWAQSQDLWDAPDEELVGQVAARGAPDAFEALVRRHGGLVLGVCRRQLRDTHDVEDAFQATFLVLLRKASSIRARDRLGCWLYGVACRVARALRARAARRPDRFGPVPEVAAPAGPCPVDQQELRRVLDEEVERLPEKYRVPLLLCHLQNNTQEQAARILGCPAGTVATRVRRGLERLRERLVRRGVCASVGAIGAALAPAPAEAAVPAS